MPPLLGSLLRRGGGGQVSDNFNRSVSSGLGQMSAGPSWVILSGAWSVNGSAPTTSTSPGNNPIAYVDMGVKDVDLSMTIGTDDAVYFHIQDQSNWWRAIWEGWQTSSCQTCCSSCCQTCYNTCTTGQYRCGQGGCYNNCPSTACSCSCSGLGGCVYTGLTCPYDCNPYSCNCTSCNCYSCNCTYYNNYRLELQKMVGGALTTIYTSSTYSTPAAITARVVTKDTNITVYKDGTSLYSGAQADLVSMTKHGFGRGSVQSYNTTGLDNFSMKWN